jgi:hypothetical protein
MAGGNRTSGVGVDFYSAPEFEGGLSVFGRHVAIKIGGYVKADFVSPGRESVVPQQPHIVGVRIPHSVLPPPILAKYPVSI